MKTINSLKLIISVIAIAAFVLLLKSCKKADMKPPDNKTAEQTKAAAIKAIKDKYGNVSAGVVYNINKPAPEYFYKDAAGNKVSLYGSGKNKPGNANGPTPTPCTYDCSTAPNASYLTITYTLDYVERFYLCESIDESNVNVHWTVSVPFNIAPFSVGNQFSEGYVQFTDPFSTTTTFTAPYTDMTMTYLGADPACSVNNLYEVTYKVTNVPNSNFANGNTIAAAVDLANNCRLVYNLVSSGYQNGPTFSQDGYLPCNRIDKVYINPNTGPSNCATVAGNYILCSPPGGSFSVIDYHQVEYRPVTSGTSLLWDDQVTGSPVNWGVPTGTSTGDPALDPYTGVSNLINMTPSTGLWLVRYRNVKTSVCDIISGLPFGSPGAPWGNEALWITEVWSL